MARSVTDTTACVRAGPAEAHAAFALEVPGPASWRQDVRKPAPRPRRRRARGVSGAKRECRLPVVAGETGDALCPRGPLPGLAFAVDHLDRLVERLQGKSLSGRAQVQALPDAPRREGRLSVVAVPDRDEAGQRRKASCVSRVFASQAAWLVAGETAKSRA